MKAPDRIWLSDFMIRHKHYFNEGREDRTEYLRKQSVVEMIRNYFSNFSGEEAIFGEELIEELEELGEQK